MIGAVDIGGTKIAVGMVDDSGKVLSRMEAPTDPNRYSGGVELVAHLLRKTAQRSRPAMVAWIERNAPADYPHRQGITAKRICELAQQDDLVALRAVEHEALYLGLGLANLINLFTPDAIVLSGSVMKSAELFMGRIQD